MPKTRANASLRVRQRDPDERLGAHVSVAGGIEHAPARGATIGATVIQIFTKTPSQWREPTINSSQARKFRNALRYYDIRVAVAHDSYLINLASPDPTLNARSVKAFVSELRRSRRLGLFGVVSHPGNYMDDRDRGLQCNAEAYTKALRRVPGPIMLLLETTAGSGTTLGHSFEELRALREGIGKDVRHRVSFCADTCHLYSAGYDLVRDYDGVWDKWNRILGLDLLCCIHLNDSKAPFGSRRDRHELIGEGTLGPAPFRRIMTDPQFRKVPKILETPKGEDEFTTDRRMIRRLRAYARKRGGDGGHGGHSG